MRPFSAVNEILPPAARGALKAGARAPTTRAPGRADAGAAALDLGAALGLAAVFAGGLAWGMVGRGLLLREGDAGKMARGAALAKGAGMAAP